MTDVSLRHLSRRFGDLVAVQELNLDIESGEMMAFLGPSGCGKTTTLRMITGLIQPTSGDVLFGGKSVLGIPTERRGAVLMFQKHLLFPTMNVAQNVGFGLKMAGVDKAEIARRVSEMLELVELPGLETRKAHELSGGQQQRVALARALVVGPEVLLLDEPLANLDANLRITMRQLIRSIQRELGITAIFVTHDQEEAVMLADRVALMFDGVLQQVGTPDVFFRCPRTIGVAHFFRNTNFLTGRRTGSTVRTEVGDLEVDSSRVPAGNGPVVLTVRPEEVQLVTGESGQNNVVPATVTSLIYMGSFTQLVVKVGRATWHVQGPGTLRVDEGDRIRLCLPRDHIWIVEDDATAADGDQEASAPFADEKPVSM
ncbi:spermidine/putrescine import ATP-binding protein PotA [bacterium BMS3Abin02]|nr:spermidine/putrescine import ATP-binding protein PotA [bacterium BMS3Abin02]